MLDKMDSEKIITKGFRKVTLSGTTHYVSIPREVREIMNVTKSDRIKVAFYYDKIPKEAVEKDLYDKPKKKRRKEKVKDTNLFIKEEEDEDNERDSLPAFDFGK